MYVEDRMASMNPEKSKSGAEQPAGILVVDDTLMARDASMLVMLRS
jgi:hypothetical protein